MERIHKYLEKQTIFAYSLLFLLQNSGKSLNLPRSHFPLLLKWEIRALIRLSLRLILAIKFHDFIMVYVN